MKPPNLKSTFAVLLCLVLCVVTCVARVVPLWPYDKLVAESDVVAIIEPVENKPAVDEFPGGAGNPKRPFTATDTRFKVHTVLKGVATNELTVLHFALSPSTNLSVLMNGPSSIKFLVGGVTDFQQPREWIAFLKKRNDGRFEPVTGHYDPVYSFRELHRHQYYAKP